MATVLPRVAPADLLKEFRRAQASELKALEHRQKLELKELKASQAARLREYEKKERDSRHEYFATHEKGPDRRDYVRDFVQRREAFLRILADERTSRTNDQEARLLSLKTDQASNLREFKEAVKENQMPSKRLWPQSGG